MADVVPDEVRGRYFALRNGLLGLIGMSAGLGAGWYLDRTPAPAGFQMVYLMAVLFALVGCRLYSFHYEPRMAAASPSLFRSAAAPLRDANFRRFLRFSIYWTFSVMLGAPFVIPYFIDHLGMTFTQLAVWTAIASVSTLFIGQGWGRVADRIGHKQVLKITTFIAGSVHPLCWILATPGRLGFIWLSGVMDALSWGGINVAMFNLGVVTAPREQRMMYLAVAGAVTGVVGFGAGLLSGVLLEFLLRHDVWIGGFHWTGYHSLFAISGALRMMAWTLLGPVREPGAMSSKEVVRWLWLRTSNLRPWRVQ
jgi:MFS family permease